MDDIYFSFGPNQAFYFSGPKYLKWRGFPSSIQKDCPPDNIRKVRCLAMGRNDSEEAFFVYDAKDGQTWSCISGSFIKKYPKLFDWMKEQGTSKLRMAFGPDYEGYPGYQGYLVWKTASSASYASIPKQTEAAEKRHKVGRLKLATFGVGWAYFYLQADGVFHYNFMGHYHTLGGIIRKYRLKAGDIQFLALNPYYVEEFFLLLSNKTAIFRVPLSYRTALEKALTRHGIKIEQALTSQRVENEPKVPAQARDTKFWDGLAQRVAGQAAGGVISQVAGALVGLAACNVM